MRCPGRILKNMYRSSQERIESQNQPKTTDPIMYPEKTQTNSVWKKTIQSKILYIVTGLDRIRKNPVHPSTKSPQERRIAVVSIAKDRGLRAKMNRWKKIPNKGSQKDHTNLPTRRLSKDLNSIQDRGRPLRIPALPLEGIPRELIRIRILP